MLSPGPFSTHHPSSHCDFCTKELSFSPYGVWGGGGWQEMPEERYTLELTSATNKWILEDKYSKFHIPWEKELWELWEVSQTISKGTQWNWISDLCRNNLLINTCILTCFHSLPLFLISYWSFLGSSHRKLSYTQILIFWHLENSFQMPLKQGLWVKTLGNNENGPFNLVD